ncbi:MAG: exonuclease SbcCD subunit D [Dehalococcoidia bacterium]|nr:MAG: exonuclease SbcCD subunit D [Dehalococcoidia bacterium]
MRFLHTADWHLGRTIRGRGRTVEFEAVLAEVCAIARDRQVDVVLVCGDIYDSTSPPPEAERLLANTLRELVGSGVEVVLIAGNHDHPRRLEALGRLAELLGVHVQSRMLGADEGGVIRIERGGEVAFVAALPWIPEGRAADIEAILGPQDEAFQSYAGQLTELYRHLAIAFTPETVNIFAAHVFVDGARVASTDGSERRLHIGQTYAVPPAAIPTAAQYTALGHIHQPQEIIGAPSPAAYAGSLLQLDFGERDQQKGVWLVEAHPGRPALREFVALTSGRLLMEVRGALDEVIAQGLTRPDAHLRAVVCLDEYEAGIAPRVREALPNCVEVRVEVAREAQPLPAPEFEHLTPTEHFVRYYATSHGTEPAPDLISLFREVMEEATASS